MEYNSGKTQKRWFYWIGLALLCFSGILFALLAVYHFRGLPDLQDIVLVVLFAIPAGPGAYLLLRGRGKQSTRRLPKVSTPLVATGEVSKRFYVGTLAGSTVLCLAGPVVLRFVPFPVNHMLPPFIILAVIACFLYAIAIFHTILFKAWDLIQDGHPRTTPGKAVGFLFIPFFNLYWIFQSTSGFAKDYNIFIASLGYGDIKLGTRLFDTFAVIFVVAFAALFTPVPFLGLFLSAGFYFIDLFVACLMIGRLCDAINYLAKIDLSVRFHQEIPT
jgi:hypothetical protein